MAEPRKMVPLIYCFGRHVGFPGMDESRFEVRRFPFWASAQASDRERLDGEWRYELRWINGQGACVCAGTATGAHEAATLLDATAHMHLRELGAWLGEVETEERRGALGLAPGNAITSG